MPETNDPIDNENIEKENVTNTNNDNDNNSNNKQDNIKDDYKKEEAIEQNGENQQTNQENLKNSIESLKGRIIASAKLLKYAESSRTEIETERSKVTKVNKQLEQQKAEYLSLEEVLKAERAKNAELKETITQLEKNQTTIVNMQNELKMITEQKLEIEKHLSGREMYINQLEAEIKNMDTQLKSKEKRRDDKLLEKKDKLIKDLQNQLKSLQKKYETAEEDKMETNIHYEMLQRDYEEKSQQLNQLKIDLQNNKNSDQKEPMSIDHSTNNLQNNDIYSISRIEHEELNKKLQQSHKHIETLNLEIQRLTNLKQPSQLTRRRSITDQQKYNDLLSTFKKCLADMDLMKREKRVLQDKLTEQLVLNEDMKTEKYKSTLEQYDLYSSYYSNDNANLPTITNIKDINNESFQEINSTINEPSSPLLTSSPSSSKNKHLHSQTNQSSSTIASSSSSLVKASHNTKKSENETRSIYGTNGLVIPEPQVNTTNQPISFSSSSRKPKLSKLEKLVGARRPATLGTAPTKRKLEITKRPKKNIILSDSSSTSSSSSSSTSSSAPASPTSPGTTSSFTHLIVSDSDEEENEKDDTSDDDDGDDEKMPPTKRQAINPLASTQVVKPLCDTSLNNTESKLQGEALVNFIIDRIKFIAKQPPTQAINYLTDMECYLSEYLHLLLMSLEAYYKSLKSATNPFAKTKYNFFDDANTYGVQDQLEIYCSRYVDISEKNLAWYLWALMTLYPKDDPYTHIVEWAYEAALTSMNQNKLVISCRFIRLLTILCRNANDRQRISTFCFDVVRCTPRKENIIHPVLNISIIWPSILDLDENGGDKAAGTNMIIKAIQRSCGHYCTNQLPEFNVNEISGYMTNLVHWPELTKSQSLKDYIQELKDVLTLPEIKQLHDVNKDAFNDFCINLIKAIELLAWRLDDWNWTYSDIIISDLWKLMKDDVLSNTSLYLMGLLARCYIPPENSHEEESEGLKYLRKTFNNIIEVGNNCIDAEFPLQVTAAKCIIMLSNYNMEFITPVINWYDQLKPSFIEKLTPDIHESIKSLKSL